MRRPARERTARIGTRQYFQENLPPCVGGCNPLAAHRLLQAAHPRRPASPARRPRQRGGPLGHRRAVHGFARVAARTGIRIALRRRERPALPERREESGSSPGAPHRRPRGASRPERAPPRTLSPPPAPVEIQLMQRPLLLLTENGPAGPCSRSPADAEPVQRALQHRGPWGVGGVREKAAPHFNPPFPTLGLVDGQPRRWQGATRAPHEPYSWSAVKEEASSQT